MFQSPHCEIEMSQFEVGSVSIYVRGKHRPARLTMPTDHDGDVPAIVFIHGSGHGDERAFRREGERFAAHGIAFLSVAKVMDNYTGLRRDYHRLAEDAAEAATWLGGQSGIDGSRIGLLGISEGCWVVTSCAARHPEIVRFAILESAAIITPADQMMYSIRGQTEDLPLPVRTLKIAGMKVTTLLCSYRDFDSLPLVKSIQQPIFAVWGGADKIVPVDRAMSVLKDNAASPLTTREVEGEGHYIDPELDWLDDVASWINGSIS